MVTYPNSPNVQYVKILDGVAASIGLQAFHSRFISGQVLQGPLLTTGPIAYIGAGGIGGALQDDYTAWARNLVTVSEGMKDGSPSVFVNYSGGPIPAMPSGIQLGGASIIEQPWFVEDNALLGCITDVHDPSEKHTILFVPTFKIGGLTYTDSLEDGGVPATVRVTFGKPLNPNQTSGLTLQASTHMFGALLQLTVTPSFNSYGQMRYVDVTVPFGLTNLVQTYGDNTIHFSASEAMTYLKWDSITTEVVEHISTDLGLHVTEGAGANQITLDAPYYDLGDYPGMPHALLVPQPWNTNDVQLFSGFIRINVSATNPANNFSRLEVWAQPNANGDLGSALLVHTSALVNGTYAGFVDIPVVDILPNGVGFYQFTLKVYDQRGHVRTRTVEGPGQTTSIVGIGSVGFATNMPDKGALFNPISRWWATDYSNAKPLAGHWGDFEGSSYSGKVPLSWVCLVDAAAFVASVVFEYRNPNTDTLILTQTVTAPTPGNLSTGNQVQGGFHSPDLSPYMSLVTSNYNLKITLTDVLGNVSTRAWAVALEPVVSGDYEPSPFEAEIKSTLDIVGGQGLPNGFDIEVNTLDGLVTFLIPGKDSGVPKTWLPSTITVPPGDYTLQDRGGTTGSISLHCTNLPSAPFHVYAGDVHDLGNLHYVPN